MPVDETDDAEDAEEESSSTISGSSGTSSASCNPSSIAGKGSLGPPSLDLAQARCRSLMIYGKGEAVARRRSGRARGRSKASEEWRPLRAYLTSE